MPVTQYYFSLPSFGGSSPPRSPLPPTVHHRQIILSYRRVSKPLGTGGAAHQKVTEMISNYDFVCVAAVGDAPEGELHASRRIMEDSLFAWRGPKLAQWACRLCSLPNSECDPLTLSAESHRFSLIRSDANPNRLAGGKGTRGAEEARNRKGVGRTSRIP